MKSVGLIVEYNPFHNGHYYHMQQSIRQTGADVAIAVMSGYFLQRGEPALVSKWLRTKMALAGGADLVVELPYAFSTGKAEIFANGAVSLLTALKVDKVCFGSEEGHIEPFRRTIEFLENHRDPYDNRLKSFLSKGFSFPKASSLAFESLGAGEETVDLSRPNNILGFHYVKAIHDQNSAVKAATIPRIGAGFHDPGLSKKKIASATGIRNTIVSGGEPLENIRRVIPETTYRLLRDHNAKYGMFHSWERLFPFLQYKLLTSTPETLGRIYEAEEGLEYRMLQSIKQADSFQSFMERLKTKRYTWTRLQRLCAHVLTNTTKNEMAPVLKRPRAPYIRILGMTEHGQGYLNQIKKGTGLPIVSTLSQHDDPLLELDERAADCYALGYPKTFRAEKLREEYATPPIRVSRGGGRPSNQTS
ncbi:MAG TPA: nucleotidyltransferase [Bacillales bacterium]|nr:nucleotidyltransferase [Bacillales bacterium]